MSDTTDSLIAALNTAGLRSDNHLFVQKLMSAVGISRYHPKKQKTESYVLATRRDGLPDLRIYFGYTTGFTTAAEAARLAKEFGVETGPSGKLKGKWFVGHPVNGGLGPRGGGTRTKKPEPVKCPRCGIWELLANGQCPDCDEDEVRSAKPPRHVTTVTAVSGVRDENGDRSEIGRRNESNDLSVEKTRRPGTRTDCPECGRRVVIRDDGTLKMHLVRKPTDDQQGPKYRETDETLAQKAKEQQFDKDAQEIDGSAQEIKGLSHSQSAIDQLMRNVTEGGQKSVTDTLLSNMADGGTAKTSVDATLKATLTDMGKELAGDKTDWILGTGGALASKLGDGVAELTRAGSPENKWAAKAVEEIKLFGSKVKGSPLGGFMSAVFSGAAFAKDTGQDHMPPVHAFLRESTAFVAGTVAGGPLKLSIVGAPLGMAIGGVASNATAYVMDTFYDMGKGVADAGGPGAALRVARWGQPPM
jgi:hypothetical protein